MEFDSLVPKSSFDGELCVKLTADSNQVVVSDVLYSTDKRIQPLVGDKVSAVWGIPIEKLNLSSQINAIIQASGDSVLMRFKREKTDDSFEIPGVKRIDEVEQRSFFPTFSISNEIVLNSIDNSDCDNIFDCIRKTSDGSKYWRSSWAVQGGDGLGISSQARGVLPLLIHNDNSFEFKFDLNKKFPESGKYRGRIRNSPHGHPQPHLWLYDVDDGGLPIRGANWRGTLVLKRRTEAIEGKFSGDCVDGDLLLESSSGYEQSFKILCWIIF